MKWGTKLPKVEGRYIITLKTPFGLQVRQADYVEHANGKFDWMLLPSCEISSSVIAWIKEPKPYQEAQP